MELYVAGVGTIPSLEQWEKDLQAVKLPFRYDKDKPKCLVRLGVGEVKLYKLFFPNDQLDTVMGLIGVTKDESHVTKRNPILSRGIAILRRALKLKKAPKPTHIIEHMQPDQINKAVGIVPIGTKEDDFDDNGMETI